MNSFLLIFAAHIGIGRSFARWSVLVLRALHFPFAAVLFPGMLLGSAITFAAVTTSTPAPAEPVVKVNPAMSTPELQSAMSRAPRGATIFFAAGTYDITGPLVVPCASNLTLTGPVATPPAAILASSASYSIFNLSNCTGIAIEYLHFENSAGIYVGKQNNSGIRIAHNLFTNIHETAAIFIDGFLSDSVVDGTLENLVSNTVIEYNAIGDLGSCTKDFPVADDDGNCAGIVTHVGELLNFRIQYNYIFHVSEGIHLQQLTTFKPGKTNAVCVSCRIEYNYVLNYHRIGIENQLSAPKDPIFVQHNVVDEPINAFYGTFAMSMACCDAGFTQTGFTGFSPSLYYNDNVTISSGAGGPGHPPYGVEWWGTGAQGLNSLVQGNFSNGYVYGFGNPPWAINHNYICGPYMTREGGYIADQQKVTPAPSQSGNVTAPSCQPTPSIASTISPAPGSYSSPLTVTLSNPGQNTSTYYTTDGTTPVPGSGTTKLYSGPFSLSLPATVKAVGMWGVPPQPLTYPSGYGFVPSSVASASYTVRSTVRPPGF
jgi:hypothetical protein